MTELATERLRLRRWQPDDLGPFAELNADEETMAFLPGALSRDQSDALAHYYDTSFDVHGLGMWAVSTHAGEFVGAVGLLPVGDDLPFGPTVETGWRLCRRCWGQGYATEAARRSLEWGFAQFGLPEIVAFTATVNLRSRSVMARLGMRRDEAADFLHPRVPAGDRLQAHVLYRLPAPGVAS